MSKQTTGRRIGLDFKATKLLENSLNELKENKKYVKANESKLASKIIHIFFDKYYEKNKKRLEESFFDQKLYLQEIIKSSNSNEELLISMSSYLAKNKPRGRRKQEIN